MSNNVVKERWKSVTGCTRCNKPTGTWCGGTFMEHHIIHDFRIKEVWVTLKVRWYKPSTWDGGYWITKNWGIR
jgi:transposase